MRLIGGERVVTKQLWDKKPADDKHNFKIEAALNFYARHYGNGIFNDKIFRIHVTGNQRKEIRVEEDLDLSKEWQLTMTKTLAQLKLRLLEIPSSGKTRRFSKYNHTSKQSWFDYWRAIH